MLTDDEIKGMAQDCAPYAAKIGTACIPILNEGKGDKDHRLKFSVGLMLIGTAFAKQAGVDLETLVGIVRGVYHHTMVVDAKPSGQKH